MTGLPDGAVETAAQAIEAEAKKYPMPRRHPWDAGVPLGATMQDLARAALEAAAPAILAAERERIAQAIEADQFVTRYTLSHPHGNTLRVMRLVNADAAKIARGES